ncbi:MAG: META domain-containing protein [Paracoccaceae bacterium]|nr:META domain-containing protein [Paracoccaceae bacterium]
MRRSGLIFALLIAACAEAEGTGGYDAPDVIWVLQSLDGAPFAADATLRFPALDRIAGEAPCNLYSGAQTGRYPAFRTGPILSTKRACPELAAEGQFFTALERMTRAEQSGETMLLSSEDGGQMVFTRRRDD